MHEILDYLPNGGRVLDLGARDGSFAAGKYPHLFIVRLDLAKPKQHSDGFVLGDAARLPFRSRAFDAVILNHSLEHFANFKLALQEAGRVMKRRGAAFVAVPDSRTLTERIYRKVYIHAGGHVNRFKSHIELSTMLSWYFGLPHVATGVLYSSFSCFNRRNIADLPAARYCAVPEPLLFAINGALRALDRHLHTRTSVYGWALYFGHVPGPVEPLPRTNVCLRCGAGHSSEWLLQLGLVQRKWVFFQAYRCPDCRALNPYTRDSDFTARS